MMIGNSLHNLSNNLLVTKNKEIKCLILMPIEATFNLEIKLNNFKSLL
jgi:hypothetical protein